METCAILLDWSFALTNLCSFCTLQRSIRNTPGFKCKYPLSFHVDSVFSYLQHQIRLPIYSSTKICIAAQALNKRRHTVPFTESQGAVSLINQKRPLWFIFSLYSILINIRTGLCRVLTNPFHKKELMAGHTGAHSRQFLFQRNPILLRRNNASIRRYNASFDTWFGI